MQPITRGEILSIAEYELIRPHFRSRIIADKKLRRLAVGDHISVVFENRDTVLYQIQEMVRTERITSEPAIAHELATYNDLIPASGQLSITLFVEIPDAALREKMLIELAGLEHSIALAVGDEVFAAHGNFAGVMPDRTTAVHYLKFDLSPSAQQQVRDREAEVALLIRHPKYSVLAPLSAASVEKLAEDLG
jgi:hypothetical protein